MQVNRCFW